VHEWVYAHTEQSLHRAMLHSFAQARAHTNSHNTHKHAQHTHTKHTHMRTRRQRRLQRSKAGGTQPNGSGWLSLPRELQRTRQQRPCRGCPRCVCVCMRCTLCARVYDHVCVCVHALRKVRENVWAFITQPRSLSLIAFGTPDQSSDLDSQCSPLPHRHAAVELQRCF